MTVVVAWSRMFLAMLVFKAYGWIIGSYAATADNPALFRTGAAWLGAAVVMLIFAAGQREVGRG